MDRVEIFNTFIRNCEEVCRHDHGHSDERAILEYLEETFGIASCRYDWSEPQPTTNSQEV